MIVKSACVIRMQTLRTQTTMRRLCQSLTVPSAKAEMTFPRADKDLLMFLASSRTAPSAPVLLT